MSSSVYDDDDDLLGDPTTIEEIVEVELEEQEEAEGSDNDQNHVEDGHAETEENPLPELQTAPEGVPVDPKKKRVVKNPQPKLNPVRLMGPRGIAVLEDTFKDFQFSGKGFEKSDLNQLMKRLEHWAHRLFPKFTFDDCLQKIETLGHKKEVKTYVKRLRMGLVNEVEPTSLCDEVNEKEEQVDEPIDAFDALIGQQLSLSHVSQAHMAHQNASLPSAQPQTQSVVKTLTEEQKERMRRNRLIAEQRKLERLKAQQMASLNEVPEATQDYNSSSNDHLNPQNTNDAVISTETETSAASQNSANINQTDNMMELDLQSS
ncbi:protein TIPIN homolog [Schistocerca gregaria]|uniref:protein TIPIN homolog n=1 Tax=Schistocerca gregaria TaxID=7010 RepID=UPI00211EBFE1|nr:protein TIPIN homolog [Schistocerca gregaria]